MKTSELTGPALDYMVHVALGMGIASCAYWLEKYADDDRRYLCEDYSTNWAQGGPIIERERIATAWSNLWGQWVAPHPKNAALGIVGSTALIAAMRCYVASRLGDKIDVPEELK